MKKLAIIFGMILIQFAVIRLYSQSSGPELKKAKRHPIQYYISLPDNWSPKLKWPVVIAVEDASKQFKTNAKRFIAARKSMPFILVVPIITTNGGQGHRDATIYPYSKSVWDTIDRISICRFDMEGLQNIIQDIKEDYSGSDKLFITGFEAGAHLVWAMVFKHPEMLYAAAPVAGNYRSRCIEDGLFSNDISRIQLPIKNFTGSNDEGFGINGNFYYQFIDAKNLALSKGYKNISETQVRGKGHEPLPEEVLDYFNTVWKTVGK
jgi:predicted peptidase